MRKKDRLSLLERYDSIKFKWDEIQSFLSTSPKSKINEKPQWDKLYAAVCVVAANQLKGKDLKSRTNSTADELIQETMIILNNRRPILWHEAPSPQGYVTKVWKNLVFYHSIQHKPYVEWDEKKHLDSEKESEETSEDIEHVRKKNLQFVLLTFLKTRGGKMEQEWENLKKIYTETISPRAFLRWRNRMELFVEDNQKEIKNKIRNEMKEKELHGYQDKHCIETEFTTIKIHLLIARNKPTPRWGAHKQNSNGKSHKPSFLRLKPMYVLFPDYRNHLCAICESIKDIVQKELRK